jgi:hypothetical protein
MDGSDIGNHTGCDQMTILECLAHIKQLEELARANKIWLARANVG